MIFLDANIFLRYLTESDDPKVIVLEEKASALMEEIELGAVQATTSEVVIHEVCFVLESKKHYELDATDIAPRLSEILKFPGFVKSSFDASIFQRALSLWEAQPQLGFADAVIAARCEKNDYELASFDGHFEAIPGLARWQG